MPCGRLNGGIKITRKIEAVKTRRALKSPLIFQKSKLTNRIIENERI